MPQAGPVLTTGHALLLRALLWAPLEQPRFSATCICKFIPHSSLQTTPDYSQYTVSLHILSSPQQTSTESTLLQMLQGNKTFCFYCQRFCNKFWRSVCTLPAAVALNLSLTQHILSTLDAYYGLSLVIVPSNRTVTIRVKEEVKYRARNGRRRLRWMDGSTKTLDLLLVACSLA